MHRWIVLVGVAAILMGWADFCQAQRAVTVSSIAVIGDPTPIGGTFAKFEDRPNLNEAGDVVFIAAVAGGRAARGIFLASSGAIKKLVAEGDPTPIGGVFQGFRLGRAAPTKTGAALFVATVGGGRGHEGIFLASPGTVTKVVAGGDPEPTGGIFGHMDDRPSANEAGMVAFNAEIIKKKTDTGQFWWRRAGLLLQPVHFPTGADMGMFVASQVRFTKIVGIGDPTPLGGTFDAFEPPVISPQGTLVLIGSISGGTTAGAIFTVSGGRIAPVLRMGDPAPGGGKFGTLEGYGINDRGEIAFRAFLEGGRATTGFYLLSQGTVTKIAAAGDDLPDGRVFDAAVGRPMVDGRGGVVFKAQLRGGGRGTGREGIFRSVGGEIAKLVVDPDPTPAGGTFGTLTPPS